VKLEQDHEHDWQYVDSDNRSEWRKDVFVCKDCKKHLTQKFTISWIGTIPTANEVLEYEEIQ